MFNREEIDRRTRAEGFTLHLPTTIGQRAAVEFEAARTLDTSIGLDLHRSRAYDEYVAHIEKSIGARLYAKAQSDSDRRKAVQWQYEGLIEMNQDRQEGID